MINKCIAIDAGGTYIKYGITDEHLNILEEKQLPTPKNKKEFLETLVNIINEKPEISNVGISMPGIITRDGFCKTAGSHTHLEGFALKEYLTNLTGRNISIINDVNAVAVCEQKEIKSDDFIIIALGTGIGGAIVKNGELIIGRNGMSGEFGFALVNNKNVNRLKTWSWTSSTIFGFVKSYNDKTGENLDGVEIFELYKNGSPTAIECVEEFILYLSVGIFNLVMNIDPERVIIGGSISQNNNIIELLNLGLKNVWEEFPELDPIKPPTIEASSNTKNSGMIGASIYALKNN